MQVQIEGSEPNSDCLVMQVLKPYKITEIFSYFQLKNMFSGLALALVQPYFKEDCQLPLNYSKEALVRNDLE